MPTNIGTNLEDVIIVLDEDIVLLWEQGDGMPAQLRFEQTLGQNLTTKLVIYGYAAFTAGRYPQAVGKVGGVDTTAGQGLRSSLIRPDFKLARGSPHDRSDDRTACPGPGRGGHRRVGVPAPDVELWTMFVSTATQENYSQIARDQAAIRGVEPRAVMQEMAGSFEELHERQPLDGYDHLAQWARQHDPAAGAGPSGLTVLAARSVESARRDPYQAVIGDQALVEQGVAAQQALDEGTIGTTSAPTVFGSGLMPNAGPLAVGPEVSGTSPDPAVAEQQQAAADQRQQQDSGTAGTATSSPSPAADTTTSDSGTSTPAPSKSTARNSGSSTTSG
jgi:hypothetical protein